MLAVVATAAVAATGLHMDLGTPLERIQRDGCRHAAAAAVSPGTSGGPENFRAAVDVEAADLVAATYRRAHGRAPARVARDAEGRCTGKVPRLSHRAVRADVAALRRRIATKLCLAVENANYEIDRVTVSEWSVQYDAFAKAERAARRRAHRGGRVPTGAAVRRDCG